MAHRRLLRGRGSRRHRERGRDRGGDHQHKVRGVRRERAGRVKADQDLAHGVARGGRGRGGRARGGRR
eukprot:6835183-Prymnesium_polylepis.2